MADRPALIPFILTPGYLWGRSEHYSFFVVVVVFWFFLLGFRNLNDHWEHRDRKNENLAFSPSSAIELCDFTNRSP